MKSLKIPVIRSFGFSDLEMSPQDLGY